MNNKRLIKKSGVYFIGNLSSKILSTLLVPIYAFYINVEDLGYYDFTRTVMGILVPIILMAIWEAVLKFGLSEDNPQVKQQIVTTSAIYTLVVTGLFAFIAIIVNEILILEIRYFFLVMSMIILHSLVYVWQYYARATSNNNYYVIAGIGSTIINFICVLIFVVYYQLGLFGLFLSYNLGQVTIILIIETRVKIFSNLKIKNFNKQILKRMLIFSSPLVLNLVFAWAISGFGRIVITLNLGAEANGLYSFASNFSLIITMIGSVITMAIIEEAILSIKSKSVNKGFDKTLQNLFMIFLTIALLGVPAIRIFYEFIAETNYTESLVYAPWLLIYAVINTMASNIGSIFQAIDKTKYQFITTLIGGVLTVLISVFFIDLLGITAVIIGQTLGALAMMITRYIIINRFIEMKLMWKPISLMFILFILITIMSINLHSSISIIIEMILLIIIFYKNRKLLSQIFSKIQNLWGKR